MGNISLLDYSTAFLRFRPVLSTETYFWQEELKTSAAVVASEIRSPILDQKTQIFPKMRGDFWTAQRKITFSVLYLGTLITFSVLYLGTLMR